MFKKPERVVEITIFHIRIASKMKEQGMLARQDGFTTWI
jgi:hypothetical protein